MLPGYSTNTISELDGIDSVEDLASMGYSSLAITLDRHVLNPYRVDFEEHVTRWADMLHRCGFASVIETGARYLLDSQQKHEPTLMSQDPTARQKRIDFLRSSIDVASSLKSTCVSLWSGVVRDSAVEETLWKRLLSSIEPVLEYAHEKNVAVALEPEPGMFIDLKNSQRDSCRFILYRSRSTPDILFAWVNSIRDDSIHNGLKK